MSSINQQIAMSMPKNETENGKYDFDVPVGGCIVAPYIPNEYIDSNGILHENFFLLPIGFLMIFSSFIIFSVAGLKNVIYKTKEKKVKKIHKN